MVARRTRSAPDADRYRSARDDEESPRSRRRAADDEDRPARRRSRDEDDEPRRGRSRRDDEDDAPRGRGRARRGEDDEDGGGRRRGRGRDDEDESLRDKAVGEGWDSYQRNREQTSDFPDEFKVPNKDKGASPVLITFLDAQPFATYNQHWLDDRKGKKSFVCLGDDCPLCKVLGDKPKTIACFNIVDMTSEREPFVRVWHAGRKATDQLKAIHNDSKMGPLDEKYYVVYSTGKGGSYTLNVNPVKERDVEEDYNVEPLSDDEWDDFDKEKYDRSVIVMQTRKALQEIAEEEAGSYRD